MLSDFLFVFWLSFDYTGSRFVLSGLLHNDWCLSRAKSGQPTLSDPSILTTRRRALRTLYALKRSKEEVMT
jgi:hypothetical protein